MYALRIGHRAVSRIGDKGTVLISSIDITFCGDQNPSDILSVLRAAGWQFEDDEIYYEVYADVADVGINKSMKPLSELGTVVSLLDDALKCGNMASVQLSWPELVYVDCTFFSPTELQILFFIGPVLQEDCGRFTDFSRLLSHIACPLHEAGYSIFNLICTDHFD